MPNHAVEAFFENARKYGSKVALRHKVDGAWRETSWEEYARLVRRAGRAFIDLGVPVGGAVAILGPNRPEWLISAMGAMAAGAAQTGIYTTSTAEQAAYVAGHAEARVLVVHDRKQLQKFRSQKDSLPHLQHFVLMMGEPDGPDAMTWEQFLARADNVPEAELDRRTAAITPDMTASLVYTSGTTGSPKGVMLTHDNALFAATLYQKHLNLHEEVVLSYLPLSHVAEQMVSIFGSCVGGGNLTFCEQLDQVGEFLRATRPTLFFAVPRVWEKIQAKMVEAGSQNPWLKKKIAAWARGVGLRAGYARLEGKEVPGGYNLASKLVFSKVKEKLGLDRCRMCISGAAAISKSTLDFFMSLDIPIYEVYGMSEDTAVSTINTPGAHRVGSVGKIVPDIELKIAEDGEILTRGRHVFKGYFKNEEATREALDADGWLRTGDVGEIDKDGFLRITDRKKDLFKTAGGKYIAPQHLEGLLKSIPGVGHAVAIGDARKYVVALFTLDPEAAPRVASTRGIDDKSLSGLAANSAFRAHIDAELQKVNAGLARYETIKKFKVLPVEFTIDSGELTPTMKLKRKVVNQKFAREIEALYEEAGSAAMAESA